MNLLTDNAPDYIEVGGKQYKINTDFVAWVRFLVAIESKEETKVVDALKGVFLTVPNNVNMSDLINAIQNWLSLSEERFAASQGNTTSQTAFDFDIDGNIIYCELWEYFPHLMSNGFSFHTGIELIKLLISNDKTMMHHRAFARCGDFSKLSKEQKEYWVKERAKYAIKAKQEDIDNIFSSAF